MIMIVNIIGVGRKTGKTYLLRKLIQRLRRRHYRVSTIKHIAEGSFDTKYKDTWQHLQAGAEQVSALSSNELITIKRVVSDSLDEVVETMSEDSDIILVEGFKASQYPKIIVASSFAEVDELLLKASNVIAIAGPILTNEPRHSSYQGIPLLQIDALVALLEQRFRTNAISRLPQLDCGKCSFASCDQMTQAIMRGEAVITQCSALFGQDVRLVVNGARVFLSAFPLLFIRNTVLGMIAPLQGAKSPKNLTLDIHID